MRSLVPVRCRVGFDRSVYHGLCVVLVDFLHFLVIGVLCVCW